MGVMESTHKSRRGPETGHNIQLPVMRPLLPDAAALTPYIEQIDAARYYTNYGALNQAFEQRLLAHYRMAPGSISTFANATLALALALMATTERRKAMRGDLCLMPSWTFVATAHAVELAGLTPYFLDVEERSWALTPEIARAQLAHLPGRAAAVLPVAPFGQPLDGAAWDRFADETGLAVVIDAAAGFDALKPTKSPAVVSLHATKAMGVGEGGFVASSDLELIDELRRRANFGFRGTREARWLGMNAKLSEYHAAIGLAQFDRWPATRATLKSLALHYRRALSAMPEVRLQEGFGESWVTLTCSVDLGRPQADAVAAALAADGIGSMAWWGRGCHAQAAFAPCKHGELAATERLAARCLGLPFAIDMTQAEIDRVAAALARALPRAL